jgi:hypothetical protein
VFHPRPLVRRSPSEYLKQLQDHKSVQLEDAGIDAIQYPLSEPLYAPTTSRRLSILVES